MVGSELAAHYAEQTALGGAKGRAHGEISDFMGGIDDLERIKYLRPLVAGKERRLSLSPAHLKVKMKSRKTLRNDVDGPKIKVDFGSEHLKKK